MPECKLKKRCFWGWNYCESSNIEKFCLPHFKFFVPDLFDLIEFFKMLQLNEDDIILFEEKTKLIYEK